MPVETIYQNTSWVNGFMEIRKGPASSKGIGARVSRLSVHDVVNRERWGGWSGDQLIGGFEAFGAPEVVGKALGFADLREVLHAGSDAGSVVAVSADRDGVVVVVRGASSGNRTMLRRLHEGDLVGQLDVDRAGGAGLTDGGIHFGDGCENHHRRSRGRCVSELLVRLDRGSRERCTGECEKNHENQRELLRHASSFWPFQAIPS